MQLLSPIEKSQSTLCSSSISVISDDSDSDLSYNECDMTLVDDDDITKCDPTNEAEMMFLQVVEMLRYEQEVRLFKNISCFFLRFY